MLLFFFAELGDKSQIVSGLFGTMYNPFLVLIGVMLALASLTIIAIALGEILRTHINPKYVEIIANSLFIIIGLLTIILVLFN